MVTLADGIQTRPLIAECVTALSPSLLMVIPSPDWAVQVKTDFQFHLIGPIEGQVLSRPGPGSGWKMV